MFFGVIAFVMNAGFVLAFLAAAYLVYGLASGQLTSFPHLPAEDRVRWMANIALAARLLEGGLAIGSVAAACIFWDEDFIGYTLVVAALLVGFGIPQGIYLLIGNSTKPSAATNADAGAFMSAMLLPLSIGGLFIVKDVLIRLIRGVKDRPMASEKMTFGRGAKAEARPVRTSLLAKCWEGEYCREFIRPHCPIFIARKACWREKRGCYCEEDIVSSAAGKVSGVHLEMAPDAGLNFANPAMPTSPPPPQQAPKQQAPNPQAPRKVFDPLAEPGVRMQGIGSTDPTISSPGAYHIGGAEPTSGYRIGGAESTSGFRIGGAQDPSARPAEISGIGGQAPRRVELTMAQKRARCHNCVIYNGHQREKYKLLMPVCVLATIVFCFVLSEPLRYVIASGLNGIDAIVSRFAFASGDTRITQFSQPSDGVEWCLIAAIALMIVSKALQVLEWAIFKLKI
jgi:hypothetical protein